MEIHVDMPVNRDFVFGRGGVHNYVGRVRFVRDDGDVYVVYDYDMEIWRYTYAQFIDVHYFP